MSQRRYDDAIRERARTLRREGKTLREIAEMMGLTFSTAHYLTSGVVPTKPGRGRRIRPWKAEWTASLGTDTDNNVAVRLGVSATTVSAHRLAAGIQAFGSSRAAAHAAKLATVSDADLATRQAFDIARELDVPVYAVAGARHNRNVRFHQPLDATNALRRAAIAGMLAACKALGKPTYNGVQSRIANVLGVSRERARQLCIEVRALLREDAKEKP